MLRSTCGRNVACTCARRATLHFSSRGGGPRGQGRLERLITREKVETLLNKRKDQDSRSPADSSAPLNGRETRLTQGRSGTRSHEATREGRQTNSSEVLYQHIRQLEELYKEGKVDETMALMDEVLRGEHEADAVVMKQCYRTALMTMRVEGEVENALLLLGRMKERGLAPDVHVYNCVLGACSRTGRVAEAEMIYEEMQAAGVEPDIATVNDITRTYVTAGRLEEARTFLDETMGNGMQPTAQSYGDVLGGHVRAGQRAEAIKLLKEVADGPIGAHPELYNAVLRTARTVDDWQTACAAWTDMRSRGEGIVLSGNALSDFIDCLSQHKQWLKVLEAYEFHLNHLGPAHPFILRHVLHAASVVKDWPKALEVATELMDQGIQLREVQLKRALKACLALGDERGVKRLHASQKDMDETVRHTQHVLALLELDRWDEAKASIGKWKPDEVPDEVFFATAMTAARGRRLPEMWAALEELESRNRVRVKGMGLAYIPVIRSLCELNEMKNASAVLRRLKNRRDLREGELSQATAYVGSAMGKQRHTEAPVSLLYDLKARGCQPSDYVYNTAMHALAQRGKVEDVLNLLDEMQTDGPTPTLVNYNTALFALSQDMRAEDAVQMMEAMRSHGVTPDITSYNSLLRAWSRRGNFVRAVEVLDEMEKNALKPDTISYNTAIAAARSTAPQAWRAAVSVLDRMRAAGVEADTITYTTLLDVLCKAGQLEEGIKLHSLLVKQGASVGMRSYNRLAMGCAMNGRYQEALDLLESAKSRGLALDRSAVHTQIMALVGLRRDYDALALADASPPVEQESNVPTTSFDAYASAFVQTGRGKEVVGVLQRLEKEMDRPATVTTLGHCLFGAMKAKDLSTAQQLMNEFLRRGVKPDFQCAEEFVRVCVSVGDRQAGLRMLDRLVDAGVKNNLGMCNLRLMLLSEAGDVARCRAVLDRMKLNGIKPNQSTFNWMMRAHGVAGDAEGIRDVMVEARALGVHITSRLAHGQLQALKQTGNLQTIFESLHDLEEKGVLMNTAAYNEVLGTIAGYGKYDRMLTMIERMRRKGVEFDHVTYYYLMTALAETGEHGKALRTYEELRQGHFRPAMRENTYVCAMRVCSRMGKYDQAIQVFEDMVAAGITPRVSSCNALMAAYGKSGRVEEAIKLMERMPQEGVKPDVASYNTLMHAYGIQGDFEQAWKLYLALPGAGLSPDTVSVSTLLHSCKPHGLWPVAIYMFDELLNSVAEGSSQLMGEAVKTTLNLLEHSQAEMFSVALYNNAVSRGALDHYIKRRPSSKYSMPIMELHRYSRAMARAALNSVLEDAVQGRWPYEQPGEFGMIIVSGAGHVQAAPSHLQDETRRFLLSRDPPLDFEHPSGNQGRFWVKPQVLLRHVNAERRRRSLQEIEEPQSVDAADQAESMMEAELSASQPLTGRRRLSGGARAKSTVFQQTPDKARFPGAVRQRSERQDAKGP